MVNGEVLATSEKFLTRSAFAVQQGWSPSYVTKLGYQGRLVLCPNEKFIDVDATLAQLRSTADPRKQYVRNLHSAARIEKNVRAHLRPDAPPDEADESCSDPKYWSNRTRREGALAELAELELGKKRGDLVERLRVETASFAAGRMLRDTVLGLPTQLAPVLASMKDASQIETKLRDALEQVFSDAERMTADDLSRICTPG